MRLPDPRIWLNTASLMARLAAVLFLVLSPPAARAAGAVTGLRIGQHGEITRLVLDLSERRDFRLFTLGDPWRLVIDLPDTEWRPERAPVLPGDGLIEAWRSGIFRPGYIRVVLDLRAPVLVEQTMMLEPAGPHRYRLVVDFLRATVAAYEREAATRNTVPWATPPSGAQVASLPRATLPDHEGPPVVVVDAGHGGVDPGATGESGVHEKSLMLEMAREVARQLTATGRYQVVMTRDGDHVVPLRERVAIARRAGAGLFVSLHADSHGDPDLHGASVYTLSETASDREAERLATRENRADIIAGVDLVREEDEVATILIDLARRETMNLSAGFARQLVDRLGEETGLLRRSHRFAGFAVLKAPDVPSVLIELGYLSNAADEARLRDPDRRARLAAAIVDAVDGYHVAGGSR